MSAWSSRLFEKIEEDLLRNDREEDLLGLLFRSQWSSHMNAAATVLRALSPVSRLRSLLALHRHCLAGDALTVGLNADEDMVRLAEATWLQIVNASREEQKRRSERQKLPLHYRPWVEAGMTRGSWKSSLASRR